VRGAWLSTAVIGYSIQTEKARLSAAVEAAELGTVASSQRHPCQKFTSRFQQADCFLLPEKRSLWNLAMARVTLQENGIFVRNR
jgi:hypothetical protein